MNFETRSFIDRMNMLLVHGSGPQNDAERKLLAEFEALKYFLNETNLSGTDICTGLNETRNLKRSLNISFHMHFKKLHDSFKCVRDYYRQSIPEIDTIYVNSLSSVMCLVEVFTQSVSQ